MRRSALSVPSRPLVAAIALTVLVTLSGCGGGSEADDAASEPAGEPAPEATEEVTDDRDPLEVVVDAVDATLDNERVSIDSQASLRVGQEAFSLFTQGSIDYGAVVSDVRFGVEQAGTGTDITILSDGTYAWVATEGDQAPELPDGADWVQGPAEELGTSRTFEPSGLLGAVVALRAAEDVDEFEPESHDGVETRVFGTTVTYADAVSAAGEDAEAFRTALSLTGEAEQSDLEIQVAVGPDGVIRTYDLSIESDAAVSGGYDIDLSDVGRDVAPPGAPDADDVATGPDAERVFSQLLGG